MGLRVKNIIEKEGIRDLCFDGVIPLSLFLNTCNDYENILHYELITKNDSFFEIEIFRGDGQIKSVLLTNCNKQDTVKVNSVTIEKELVISGQPVVDTSVFNTGEDYFDRFFREEGFRIEYNSQGVRVVLNDNPPSKFVEVCKGCFFGVSSENDLVSFTALDLNDEQVLFMNNLYPLLVQV